MTMTLHEILLEVRNRLLDSGDFGPGWSATADGTAVMQAIERIQQLESELAFQKELLSQYHRQNCQSETPAEPDGELTQCDGEDSYE